MGEAGRLVLTDPEGRDWTYGAGGALQELRTDAGRLFIGASGVTGLSGETLAFLRDEGGRIARAVAPDGTVILYDYDAAGRLESVRSLASGEGTRHGYDEGDRLITSVAIGGAGRAIDYAADGDVRERAILADMGGIASFTGQLLALDAASEPVSVTLSLRESELRGAPGEQVILRLAIDGAERVPQIAGAQLLSLESGPEGMVALFGFTAAGLYRLDLGAGGAAELQLALAGDLDGDGRVDGSDAALLAEGGPGADITGDGAVTPADRQVLFANHGVQMNVAPVAQDELPELLTHVDRAVFLDLSTVARDPDGDRVFFRMLDEGTQNITATFTGDGSWMRLLPDPDFAGTARLTLVADDGYLASDPITLEVQVSDAPLLEMDFASRDFRFDMAGQALPVTVIGQYADAADVPLDPVYANLSVLDETVARLAGLNVLLARGDGDTVLMAERDGVAAATVVGVGMARDPAGMVSQYFGIEPYPEAVTLLPEGERRQIVTMLGTSRDIFLEGEDGVRFISGNSNVVTVSEDGVIEAVGPGRTTVTVIFRHGEALLDVAVVPPVDGASGMIDAEGGALRSPEGIVASFGTGQIEGSAEVSLTPLDAAALDLPLPVGAEFVTGIAVGIDGTLAGSYQLAAPVMDGAAEPGETVYFFVEADVSALTDGALDRTWLLMDSGTVGADGVVRTTSPPFPGLSKRGNVVVAKFAQPLATTRISGGEGAVNSLSHATALGFGALGFTSSIGFGMTGTLILPHEITHNIKQYTQYADRFEATDLEVPVNDEFTLTVRGAVESFPRRVFDSSLPNVTPEVSIRDDQVLLRISGTNMVNRSEPPSGRTQPFGHTLTETRVVFEMGDKKVTVYGGDYESTEHGMGERPRDTIELLVPKEVLLGRATIYFERPDPNLLLTGDGVTWPEGTTVARSAPMTIAPDRGYGISMAYDPDTPGGVIAQILNAGPPVQPTPPDDPPMALPNLGAWEDEESLSEPDEDEEEEGEEEPETEFLPGLLRNIALEDGGERVLGAMRDTLIAGDGAVAYVATDRGIAIIDMVTLRQFDADPDVDGASMIKIPGGRVQTMALAPDGNYLYAAGLGQVHKIDLRPGSDEYLKSVRGGVPLATPAALGGKINHMAVSSDGRKLFVAVPHSQPFGANSWVGGGGEDGKIFVINVNPADRDRFGYRYLEVIGELDGRNEPFRIFATSDPHRLAFTSRGNLNSGFHTITITNSDPRSFTARVETPRTGHDGGAPLRLNQEAIGIQMRPNLFSSSTGGFYSETWVPSSAQSYDLDIRNAAGLVVAPDLSHAFVSDWGVSRQMLIDPEVAQRIESAHNVGSNVGLILNPFDLTASDWAERGLDQRFAHSAPQLASASSPIPLQFITDLALTPDGTVLYVNVYNAGVIATYDVQAWIDETLRRADAQFDSDGVNKDLSGSINRRVPIDRDPDRASDERGRNLLPNDDVIVEPIDVQRRSRGLSIEAPNTLRLIGPKGELRLQGAGAVDDLVFELRIDTTESAAARFEANLFLSTQKPKDGLFPSDPPRKRDSAAGQTTPELPDGHPFRLLNSPRTAPGEGGFSFESGYSYVLGADGSVVSRTEIAGDAIPEGLQAGQVLRIQMSDELKQLLTVGQAYFWGVEARLNGRTVTASTGFRVLAPVVETPYPVVNVLTHGLILDPKSDAGNSALSTAALGVWMDRAKALDAAAGGGVVLVYNRSSGNWHRMEAGGGISTSAATASALRDGRPVTLVLDWARESDITDSGYAEAAADAAFAALVHLNAQVDEKVFQSPLHFIGAGRGAVVNSEIIQRLGWHFEDTDLAIHMTTLDPHDSNAWHDQTGPAVMLQWLRGLAATAEANKKHHGRNTALAKTATEGLAVLETLMGLSGRAGVQMFPMPFSAFDDPPVQVWRNVQFADNYYQQVLGALGSSGSASPRGHDLPSMVLPVSEVRRAPNISYNFTTAGLPGFQLDDTLAFLSDRVASWYFGTVNTNAQWLGSEAIWRTASDMGLRVGPREVPASIANPFGEVFATQPWYGVSPQALAAGTYQNFILAPFPQIVNSTELSSLGTGPYLPNEAIGMGWFFSPVGGGLELRPGPDFGGTPISFDNTRYRDDTRANQPGADAVPEIFNGNFEFGTRHALTGYLNHLVASLHQAGVRPTLAHASVAPLGSLSKPFGFQMMDLPEELGRMPFDFTLPGWSMHGGKGAEAKLLKGIAPEHFSETNDMTALFLVNTWLARELGDVLYLHLDRTLRITLGAWGDATEHAALIAQHKIDRLTIGQHTARDQMIDAYLTDRGYTVAGSGATAVVRDAAGEDVMPLAELRAATEATLTGLANIDFTTSTARNLANFMRDLHRDHAMYLHRDTPPPDLMAALALPARDATEAAAKRSALNAVADWLRDNVIAATALMIERAHDGQTVTGAINDREGTDFALMLGGGVSLQDLMNKILPGDPIDPLATVKPGTKTERSLAKLVSDAIKDAKQLDSITHNRMFIPADAEVLDVDVLMPIAWGGKMRLEVSFTDTDGTVHGAKKASVSSDSEDADADKDDEDGKDEKDKAKTLARTHFSKQTVRFDVPSEVRGKVATITLRHSGLEVEGFAPPATVNETAQDATFWISPLYARQTVLEGRANPLSAILFIDNLRFDQPDPQRIAADGPGAGAVTLAEVEEMLAAASSLWAESGLVAPGAVEMPLTLRLEPLQDGRLAEFREGAITLDPTARGHGWFVDPDPLSTSGFVPTEAPHLFRASEGPAAGRVDLLTVLMHEIGNAMGLSDIPPGDGGDHLMSALIETGMRRLPAAADVERFTEALPEADPAPDPGLPGALSPLGPAPAAPVPAGGPAMGGGDITLFSGDPAGPFGNGDFAVPLSDPAARWQVVGSVAQGDGFVRVTEDAARISGLFQTFTLPTEATGLQFTLRDINLNQQEGFPPDAFEVALFDPARFNSLLAPIATLPGTDAILNIQIDGTIHSAPGVEAQWIGGDLVVIVDLRDLGDRPEAAVLSFDLIGFGRIDSGVTVATARLLGVAENRPPVAVDDVLVLDEGSTGVVDLLANDSDPDGDPLSARIVTPPASGTLEPLGGGLFRFTPEEGFFGELTASYVAFDGALESNLATLTITVNQVNQPPVLAPVTDQRVPTDTALELQLEASDREDDPLTFTLVAGPEGATVDLDTGLLRWPGQAAPGTAAFTVAVSDGEFTVEQSFTVTITAAPVLAPIAPVGVKAGTVLEIPFALVGPVADPAALDFALDGPDWLVLARDTGLASGRITGDTTGRAGFAGPVTLTVSDPDGLSDTVSFTLTVLEAEPPVLAPLAPQVLRPGEALALTAEASDPEGEDAELRFTFTGPRPDWLEIDAVSGAIMGTPPPGSFGAFEAMVQATSTQGLTATQPLTIRVLAAPVLILPPAPVLASGEALDLTLGASDPDTDPADLRFALLDGPDWVALDPVSGRLSGDSTGQFGAFTLRVELRDPDGLTDEGTLTLTVVAAPVLAPIADQRLAEGLPLSVSFAATDADTPAGDLVFSLDGPDWLVLERDEGAGTGRITGVTDGRAAPAVPVTFTVSDPEGASSSVTFTLTVLAAPVLSPLDDVVITEAIALSVPFVATDADTQAGDLVFSLDGPDWLVLERDEDAGTGRITGDPEGRVGPALPVTLTVTDPDGLTDSVSFTLTVLDGDRLPPLLTLPEEFRLAPGAALSATAAATDPDGDDAALRFALVAAPGWVALDPVSGALSGAPPDGAFGPETVALRVTDSDGLSATGQFDLILLAAPILTAPPEVILIAGQPLDLLARASDPDGDDALLRFSLEGAPDWIAIDPVTGRITGDSSNARGTYLMSLVVTDADGLSDALELEVTVRIPPRFESIRDMLIWQGDQVVVMPQMVESDTPRDGLSFAMVEGPDWLSLDPVTGRLSGDSAGQSGAALVTLLVTDPLGLSDEISFRIDIRQPAAQRPAEIGRVQQPIVVPPRDEPALLAPSPALSPSPLPGLVLAAHTSGRGPQQDPDPFCLSPRMLQFGALRPGDLEEGTLGWLPMIFESQGGVREIVLEVSWLSDMMELLGVNPGDRVPDDAQLTFTRSEDGPRSVLHLTLRSQSGVPPGALELLSLMVRSDLLAYGGLDAVELRLKVLEINGADVCAPLPGAEEARMAQGPMRLAPPAPDLAEAAEAVIALELDLFGAAVHHPGAVDSALLEGGLLPLRISGLAGADQLVLGLAWDPAALTLAGAEVEGGAATLKPLAEGAAELHLRDLSAPVQGAAVLAALALVATAGRRRGAVRVTRVTVDGVELMLNEAEATGGPAVPVHRPMRWSASEKSL